MEKIEKIDLEMLSYLINEVGDNPSIDRKLMLLAEEIYLIAKKINQIIEKMEGENG